MEEYDEKQTASAKRRDFASKRKNGKPEKVGDMRAGAEKRVVDK